MIEPQIQPDRADLAAPAPKTLVAGGRLLSLETPLVMGVLNLTPDSFYEGSRVQAENELLARAERMLSEGADLLDVGGYSSRPGAEDVPPDEELKRVSAAVRAVCSRFPEAVVSVDTFRSPVAEAAVSEGASLVNDISGGQLDEAMFETVARLGTPYLMMHMRGTPQTMKGLTDYDDLMGEILRFFAERLDRLKRLGVKDVILDPGFGFAKTREQNFALLKRLPLLKMAGKPLLVGLSRKSMAYKTLGVTPAEALNGTTALHALALANGANLLRVHDVKEAKETIRLHKAYESG